MTHTDIGSLTRTLKRLVPLALRRSVIRRTRVELGAFLVDSGRHILGVKDDLMPPTRDIFVGMGDFKAIGYEFLRYFTELGRLQPHEAVLDIGCGIGRMAIPLTQFLRSGRYEGIDIVPKGIEWCQRHITPRCPNFHFQLADIYNKAYNPRGRYRAAEYLFPFPDASFDFIFLTSVFTHMLERDAEHYVAEIARMLRPGGRVLSTWFLLNAETRRLMMQHPGVPQIVHPTGDNDRCLAVYADLPEEIVGYDEAYVRATFVGQDLRIEEPLRYGNWCRRADYTTYQDIIVAARLPESSVGRDAAPSPDDDSAR